MNLIDICVYIFIFFTDQNNRAALIVFFAYWYDKNKMQSIMLILCRCFMVFPPLSTLNLKVLPVWQRHVLKRDSTSGHSL